MMRPLFSTAYLPPVGYIAAMAHYPEVLIEAKETFPKQTYRNRAWIATAGGVRELIVPVVRGNHSRTEEVTIDYHTRWNIVHLRTLTAAYAAAPYFEFYYDELDSLLTPTYSTLLSLNQALLQWLLGKLRIPAVVRLTDDYCPAHEAELDMRNTFSPKRKTDTEAYPPYYQVFTDRLPFLPDLSVIDLLMNLGPEARTYLDQIKAL